MAQSGMVQNIMEGLTSNPKAAAVALLAGFILGYALHWKRNRGMGGLGGGFP